MVRTYPSTGNFTVSATLSSGATATLTVKVIGAPTFVPPVTTPATVSPFILDVLDGGFRQVSLSSVAPGLVFEVPADRVRMDVTRTLSTAIVTVFPVSSVPFGIAARLFAGGPILAVQRINVIGVSDASQNKFASMTAGNISGYKLLNSPLTVANLPTGGRIEMEITRGGTMFQNGSGLKVIYPSEVLNGWVNVQFYSLLTEAGGYCHMLRVYDRNGSQLEGRWGVD